MTLAIQLGIVIAYLWVGFWKVGPTFVARQIEHDCNEYSSIATPDKIAEWRREAAVIAIFIAIIWPAYLLGRALTGRLAKSAPLSRYEHDQQIAERDQRIADLERQKADWERGDR